MKVINLLNHVYLIIFYMIFIIFISLRRYIRDILVIYQGYISDISGVYPPLSYPL